MCIRDRNITGRPEEPEEQQELSDTIQKLAESLAPDIFPPKTFEEMDDSEQAASAVNMIEERLRNGGRRRETAAPQSQQEMTPQQNSSQMQSESHEENPFAQVMENENAKDVYKRQIRSSNLGSFYGMVCSTAWLACQLSDFLWILQNWKVERSCFKNGRLDEESSKSHPLYL